MNTPHVKRPPDAVHSTNGFEEAKQVVNFRLVCDDIERLVRRDGPWETIKRVLGGKNARPRFEGMMEKPCRVCHRVKPFGQYKISKVHNGKVSRVNVCKECGRIARRMRREGRTAASVGVA